MLSIIVKKAIIKFEKPVINLMKSTPKPGHFIHMFCKIWGFDAERKTEKMEGNLAYEV